MSDIVEVVRRSNEAFNRGDLDAVVPLADPEIQIEDLPDMPEASTVRAGRVVGVRFYASPAQTLEAAGLASERPSAGLASEHP